jgi:hypothetical protein
MARTKKSGTNGGKKAHKAIASTVSTTVTDITIKKKKKTAAPPSRSSDDNSNGNGNDNNDNNDSERHQQEQEAANHIYSLMVQRGVRELDLCEWTEHRRYVVQDKKKKNGNKEARIVVGNKIPPHCVARCPSPVDLSYDQDQKKFIKAICERTQQQQEAANHILSLMEQRGVSELDLCDWKEHRHYKNDKEPSPSSTLGNKIPPHCVARSGPVDLSYEKAQNKFINKKARSK